MAPAFSGVATATMQGPAGAGKRTVGIVFDKVMEYHMREGQYSPAVGLKTASAQHSWQTCLSSVHLCTQIQASVKQVP